MLVIFPLVSVDEAQELGNCLAYQWLQLYVQSGGRVIGRGGG